MKPLLFICLGCLLLSSRPGVAGDATEDLVADLIKDLDDPKTEVRVDALERLARLGANARPAVPALAAALADKQAGAHAAGALGKLGPGAKDAIAALAGALQNSEVRAYAAQALADLGALEPLVKALGDKDEDVRIEAVLALK